MTMLSYHNDPAVKQKYVARFAQHRAADQVIQGLGYDSASSRGCFVGCTLEDYDHSRFPVELGWPQWLAHLADKIFEGLPREEAPQFGTDLLDAVPVGADLEPVRHLLTLRRLDHLIELQKDCQIDGVLTSLKLVRDCHEAELEKNVGGWNAAAWSAESAAWSAARSAARSAAWSAAWSAVESAVESAESAARSAESAYRQERDDLLEILRGLEA